MTEGKYLYCIVKENKNKSFGCIGINNREVNTVHYKDIAAVVSSTPIINLDRLDKKELMKYVTVHQRVNEEIMSAKGGFTSDGKEYDLVPMAFGIIAPGLNEVESILENVYLQFKAALKNITGKAEFVVQVWWDPKKLLEELANTNPEIQKLKQKVALKGSILGMPIKLKLGKIVAREMENQRQTFITGIQASLKNLSHDFTLNRLIDNAMIANFSFLIEKAEESELDKKMQELGEKYENKLRFKYIGPMPPYSFTNINLSLGNFEMVDEARKILELSEEATFDEIKRAYYELSRRYHPDKLGGDETQMKRISKAHDILESYYRSCDELLGQKSPAEGPLRHSFSEASETRPKGRQKYSFKKEDVENSLIIK